MWGVVWVVVSRSVEEVFVYGVVVRVCLGWVGGMLGMLGMVGFGWGLVLCSQGTWSHILEGES